MARPLTIVMYHYVRDPDRSRYPDINGLTVDGFRHQLDYIRRFYDVVGMDEVVAACTEGRELPDSPLLLTFDDGLADHYHNVFPVLEDAGLTAAFFASSQPFLEGRVLDVHKIHHVLAAGEAPDRLLSQLLALLRDELPPGGWEEMRRLVDGYEAGRYDAPEVIAVKRLLQRDLPRSLRTEMVDRLFREHVSREEESFSRDLYLNEKQVREMQASGMFFGCHGHSHVWLDRIDPTELQDELDRSLAFLEKIDAPTEDWVMCYPYGATSPKVMEESRRRGCAVGLLAEPGIANLDERDPLELPRLDTNDLPQRPVKRPNKWTERGSAMQSERIAR